MTTVTLIKGSRYWVQKRWCHNLCFHFSVLDTLYRWSMMKNIHNPFGGKQFIGTRDMAAWLPITAWNQANLHIFQWGYLGIYAAISRTTMNQFMSNLVSEDFSPCSTEIWSWKWWNVKKKNLMTSHFSTLYLELCKPKVEIYSEEKSGKFFRRFSCEDNDQFWSAKTYM